MEADDGTKNGDSSDQQLGNITRAYSSRESSKPFQSHTEVQDEEVVHATSYKVYKRRFFGLTQLVLLNVVVSWDVCSLLISFPLRRYEI